MNNFERYLIDKGYKCYYINPKTKVKEVFKHYSTIDQLCCTYEKDNIMIYYGIYEYGYNPNLFQLFNYIDMVNYRDEKELNITDIIIRIEKQFDFEFIEQFFINGKKGKFIYDYKTNSIEFKNK